jgi:uncharacterized membrane protein
MKSNTREGLKSTTGHLVRAAVIAALYAAVTLAVYPLSYGPVQIRFSEALTILPLFWPEAIPGLFVGCFLANIPMGPWDMLIGSIATLLAALLTRLSKKIYFGVWPPILFNAFMVPLIFLTIPEMTDPYWFNVLTVGAGQLISVLALGIPLYVAVKKLIVKNPSLMR